MNEKYLVFIHDIDIVLNIDEETIINFYNFMENNNVDRIDLKQTHNLNVSDVIEVYKNKPVKQPKNKDGTAKNALDMKGTNLLTGGSLVKR